MALSGSFHTLFNKNKATKTIAIITEVGSRLGDVSAANKLAELIKNKHPEFDIKLILLDVRADINKILGEKSNYTSLPTEFEYIANNPEFENLIKDSQINEIIFFPNVEGLSIHTLDTLKLKLPNVDIKKCYEYDHTLLFGQQEATLATGLSKGALGVFLKDEPDYSISMEERFKKTISSLENPLLKKIYANTSISDLKEKRAVFFGYHNPERGTFNGEYGPETYARLCFRLAQAEKKKNIDIIMNKAPANDIASQLIQDGASEVEILGENSEIIKNENDDTGPKIRLFDPFPLSKQDFASVLSLSHPFVMLTGDQSATEGLSTYHFLYETFSVLLYQTKDWKVLFSLALIDCAAEILGKESPYTQLLTKFNNPQEPLDEDEIIKLILSPNMRNDTIKLYKGLMEKYNIANNLDSLLKSATKIELQNNCRVEYDIYHENYITNLINFPLDILKYYSPKIQEFAQSIMPEIKISSYDKNISMRILLDENNNTFSAILNGLNEETKKLFNNTEVARSISYKREINAYALIDEDQAKLKTFLSDLKAVGIDVPLDDIKLSTLRDQVASLGQSILQYQFPHFEQKEDDSVELVLPRSGAATKTLSI